MVLRDHRFQEDRHCPVRLSAQEIQPIQIGQIQIPQVHLKRLYFSENLWISNSIITHRPFLEALAIPRILALQQILDIPGDLKIGENVKRDPITKSNWPSFPWRPIAPFCPPRPCFPGVPANPFSPTNPGCPSIPLRPGAPDNPELPGGPLAPGRPGSPDSPSLATIWSIIIGIPGSPGGPGSPGNLKYLKKTECKITL